MIPPENTDLTYWIRNTFYADFNSISNYFEMARSFINTSLKQRLLAILLKNKFAQNNKIVIIMINACLYNLNLKSYCFQMLLTITKTYDSNIIIFVLALMKIEINESKFK